MSQLSNNRNLQDVLQHRASSSRARAEPCSTQSELCSRGRTSQHTSLRLWQGFFFPTLQVPSSQFPRTWCSLPRLSLQVSSRSSKDEPYLISVYSVGNLKLCRHSLLPLKAIRAQRPGCDSLGCHLPQGHFGRGLLYIGQLSLREDFQSQTKSSAFLLHEGPRQLCRAGRTSDKGSAQSRSTPPFSLQPCPKWVPREAAP